MGFDNLNEQQKQKTALALCSLLLIDDGRDVTKDHMKKVLEASGFKILDFYFDIYQKAMKGKSLNDFTSGSGSSQ